MVIFLLHPAEVFFRYDVYINSLPICLPYVAATDMDDADGTKLGDNIVSRVVEQQRLLGSFQIVDRKVIFGLWERS